MEGRLQSENSKVFQCMKKSWFDRNFSYTWEYQQHVDASSQKRELTLCSSVNEIEAAELMTIHSQLN